MPLSAALASAFQHIATVITDLDKSYFDTTNKAYKHEIDFDGRRFQFLKLGYSKSGSFEGINYQIRVLQPDGRTLERYWNIWIQNPSSSVAVNCKAVVGAIQTIIEDPNTGKIAWTLDASDYADTA